MGFNQFESFPVVLFWIVLIGSGCCDSRLTSSLYSQQGSLVNTSDPEKLHFDVGAFHVTADFVLRLNELIKTMTTFMLDGSLDTRLGLKSAEEEWNRTESLLADHLDTERAGNPTLATTLSNSLTATRQERIKFIKLSKLMDSRTNAEISGLSVYNDLQDATATVQYPLPLPVILYPSVAGLQQVSENLLRSMEINVSKQYAQSRTSATAPSVEEFLSGFFLKTRETKRILAVEAKRALRRTKARLSVLPESEDLKFYTSGYSHIILQFIKRVIYTLTNASNTVNMTMITDVTTVDQQLSNGLAKLLRKGTNVDHFTFLELCLNRYVYRYYEQSQAAAKLLYCAQQEFATLEYLLTVFGTILERAPLTDSSAVQMTIICSMGSSSCMNNYYTSLDALLNAVHFRFEGYISFIEQEMDAMVARIMVCTQSTVFEIEAFAAKTTKSYNQCLSSGKIN